MMHFLQRQQLNRRSAAQHERTGVGLGRRVFRNSVGFIATIVLSMSATACHSEPVKVEVGLARGQELYDTCTPCHGAAGDGKAVIEAPAIAGMDEWYLKSQLQKFKTATRGAHPDDDGGMRMRPMARSLDLEGDLESVAMFVAQMSPTTPESTLEGGDAKLGESSYMACAACHGANGKGMEALKAPSLVGQSDWYLAKQLDHFKKGIRGANVEQDPTAAAMVGMAATLPDEQAILNVVAYIKSL